MSSSPVEETFAASGSQISVSKQLDEQGLTLTFHIDTDQECRLHWGLRPSHAKGWQIPPRASWPKDTTPFDERAVQSPFQPNEHSEKSLRIHLDAPLAWRNLPFVLYFPEDKRWVKNNRQDFVLALPVHQEGPGAVQALADRIGAEGIGKDQWQSKVFDLGEEETLAATVRETEQAVEILLVCESEAPLMLHWGLAARFRNEWQLPPPSCRPKGSIEFDHKAVHTPFVERDGLRWLEISFDRKGAFENLRGMNFILHQPDGDRWIKAGGKDMHLDLRSASDDDGALGSTQVRELADEIIGEEMGRSSWTLMHRFNLCHDLLDGAENSAEALALLYTWLRYSALRQLDWQRHYNTQPRELSHAQDRLTTRLAGAYKDHPVSRPWVRLMLTTLGPGGEGQRVRDEILHIMHRHHIKEVHGHFMEEWHQKLHNNTTPDDIVICEAYLAFLHSDGDLQQFYDTLENAGVTRARLASFERPIQTDPWFYADKKAGLIHDFQHFLGILHSVHSGTDMTSAAAVARDRLDGSINQQIDRLLSGQDYSAPVLAQVEQITAIREPLRARIGESSDAQDVRDLLYLDLALEQTLRGIVEQQALRQAEVDALSALTLANLDNLRLSVDDPEFLLAAHQLYPLAASPNESTDWALRVKSVTDRIGRVIGEWSNRLYEMLQPKAEFLGKAFDVEHWTIPLFSEEVIRGSPPFMLSLLLRRLDPLLRAQAGLGGWQVISPARADGRVRVVESLLSVQGERYREPTLLVTDKVSGEEEIPSGVTSIITSDTPDLVSHVAVRARNAQVLFASCYDAEPYDQIKHLQGERLTLQVSPSGDVKFAESEKAQGTSEPLRTRGKLAIRRRRFSTWALESDKFDDEKVGGKSNNLNALRGSLSDWVHFPASMALPFGVFEKSLRSRENQALAHQYESLLGVVDQDPAQHLPGLRELPLKLTAPAALQQALANAWTSTGLPPMKEESIWRAIARVWASKWNDRAYYSRAANGIAHEKLMIAVLIQQVVEADYAFVIHSVNPMTGNKDEVFAEVVLGMGETLVGNYPGRALGFLCRKSDLKLSVLSYPSKSKGLYGSGVIFRSDSNGEDLEGFAGAGLYDSFLADPPAEKLLNYTHEPLFNDQTFAQALMVRIAQLAIEVEQAFGSPQDIEGAVQKGEYYIVQSRPQVGLD